MIPIRVLGDEEVSGVQMVFDYSGIAKQQNGGDYLSVIVLCGGILSVMIGRKCDRCRRSGSSAVWEGCVGAVGSDA